MEVSPLRTLVRGVLLLVVSHAAALAGSPGLAALAVAGVCWLPLAAWADMAPGPGRRAARHALALAGLAGVAGALSQAAPDLAFAALMLPSVLWPLGLGLVFAVTLKPGGTALITRIADAAHGPLPAAMTRYTRTLTGVWAGLLLLVAALHAGLWLAGRADAWSWAANVLTPVGLGAFFVADYVWRRRRFPDDPHPGFGQYLGLVARAHRLFRRTA